jgi:hypothetical protein
MAFRWSSCRRRSPRAAHDAALAAPQRHALEHQDHVVVDHLDIVDRQDRFSTCAGLPCAASAVPHPILPFRVQNSPGRPAAPFRCGGAVVPISSGRPRSVPATERSAFLRIPWPQLRSSGRTTSVIGSIQVRNLLPLLAVPLLDEHRMAAFMVFASHFHRVRKAFQAQLCKRASSRFRASRPIRMSSPVMTFLPVSS